MVALIPRMQQLLCDLTVFFLCTILSSFLAMRSTSCVLAISADSSSSVELLCCGGNIHLRRGKISLSLRFSVLSTESADFSPSCCPSLVCCGVTPGDDGRWSLFR
ncbi:hypothetical protein XENORESO_020177 [Xenotaenia resolanae]|uniref:Secreted protein n=1 Tax=Xenotaenia resolanae TaxID=208358 RepID=A0ABV0X3M8_9TELE